MSKKKHGGGRGMIGVVTSSRERAKCLIAELGLGDDAVAISGDHQMRGATFSTVLIDETARPDVVSAAMCALAAMPGGRVYRLERVGAAAVPEPPDVSWIEFSNGRSGQDHRVIESAMKRG